MELAQRLAARIDCGVRSDTCSIELMHKPTYQQTTIWNEIQNGNSHLIIEARAGTGKTSTLVEAIKMLPKQKTVLFCAFNRKIVEDINKKLPKGRKARTLHSFGLAQVKKNCERPDDPEKDKEEYKMINEKVYELIKSNTDLTDKTTIASLKKLVGLCKCFLCSGTKEEYDVLRYLVRRFGLEMPKNENDVFSHVENILHRCATTAWENRHIDNDDMIWLPAQFPMKIESFDYVFVDEAQDLNLAQQELMIKACPDGKMVFIGDRYQSIYGFRGADIDSIPRLQERLSKTTRGVQTLNLTQTFRCPLSHVALAKKMVKDIEPSPDSKKGQVTYIPSQKEAFQHVKEGDMIICRTNAPLLPIAKSLSEKGYKVILSGNQFGDELKRTIQMFPSENMEQFGEYLGKFSEKHLEKLQESFKSGTAIADFIDKIQSLKFLYNESKKREEIDESLKKFFVKISDETDISKMILLSSIHGVKGLEAENVYILNSNLLPHPYVKEEWEFQQEKNLAYVAATRAKSEIILVDGISEYYKDILTSD